MRIIAGAWRGRRIATAPSGRPTTDRVREAVFSIWQEFLEGARFLDLFCAGGGVGLEAASRGAARVVLVDRDPRALRVARRNCRDLGASVCETVRLDLPRGLSRGALDLEGFDLIYADPPYDFDRLEEVLEGAAALMAPHAMLALEHSRRRSPAEECGPLVRTRSRTFGETSVAFYSQAESA